MKGFNVDISNEIRKHLQVDSFVFNPSIAHLRDDIYLISVRAYVHDKTKPMDENPKLLDNPQHPWGTSWDGLDQTLIFLARITDTFEILEHTDFPIIVNVQDMRIFRFAVDGSRVSYILTFNELYQERPDMVIKGGDTCDDFCYLIGWAYLVVNTDTLKPSYVPGQLPLCPNISNPVDKNWSLWTAGENGKIQPVLSYMIAPEHTAFTFQIEKVSRGELVGGSKCILKTPHLGKNTNFYGRLEKFYDSKLIVSLSTPAYPIDDNVYQAVGHLKVRINYLRDLARKNVNTPLAKFAQKHAVAQNYVHFNPSYMYFMYLYKFVLEPFTEEHVIDYSNKVIEISDTRMLATITHTTKAFIIDSSEYNYYLNFPSGMVVENKDTIISYGNGDASSHLLFLDNDELESFYEPIDKINPAKFKFKLCKVHDGTVTFK